MDRKCWFVLRHRHYPPPTSPKDGIGCSKGPICCGHLIPDLKHLDNVINRDDLQQTTPDMPVYATQSLAVTWTQTSNIGVEQSIQLETPIAAAAGITARGNAGIAFQKSVNNFSQFRSLDTYIIQVRQSYIEDSIESDEVSKYIEQHKILGSWSVFMITGIVVARGAYFHDRESKKVGGEGGVGMGYAGIAESNLKNVISREKDSNLKGQVASDFIWAIRLAKISKGMLDTNWSFETYSKGATYDLDKGSQSGIMRDILHEEGIADDQILVTEGSDEMFVLGV